MIWYISKRLLQTVIVFLALITISFFMTRLAPGDPFSSDKGMDPTIRAAMEAKYDLDKPLPLQYWRFLKNLAHGDLGPSLKHKSRTVNEIIAATVPNSLCLGTIALLIALMIGLPAGTIAAIRHNTVQDYGTMVFTVIGISLPTFVIGPILQMVFASYVHWFPLAGFDGLRSPSYILLPAVTLALPFAARIARLMRAGMLEVLSQDFVKTAHAKGLPERTVILRHCMRGALLPVISFLGPAVAAITTGSLVVERIFQIPGLGREFVESALNRDYTLVMGTVIVYGGFLILCNFVVDLFYGVLDPRIRYS